MLAFQGNGQANVKLLFARLSVVSTVCSIVAVVTCSRNRKWPARPCSSSRLTCPSTSLLVSRPTCAATRPDRLSLSACSTTGRSCPAIHSRREAGQHRSWLIRANARVLRRVFQPWTSTWTSCKPLCSSGSPGRLSRYSSVSFIYFYAAQQKSYWNV